MSTQNACAADQQTMVCEDINRSIQQIAEAVESVTQEVQQRDQIARNLKQLSESLNAVVKQFRV